MDIKDVYEIYIIQWFALHIVEWYELIAWSSSTQAMRDIADPSIRCHWNWNGPDERIRSDYKHWNMFYGDLEMLFKLQAFVRFLITMTV